MACGRKGKGGVPLIKPVRQKRNKKREEYEERVMKEMKREVRTPHAQVLFSNDAYVGTDETRKKKTFLKQLIRASVPFAYGNLHMHEPCEASGC